MCYTVRFGWENWISWENFVQAEGSLMPHWQAQFRAGEAETRGLEDTQLFPAPALPWAACSLSSGGGQTTWLWNGSKMSTWWWDPAHVPSWSTEHLSVWGTQSDGHRRRPEAEVHVFREDFSPLHTATLVIPAGFRKAMNLLPFFILVQKYL